MPLSIGCRVRSDKVFARGVGRPSLKQGELTERLVVWHKQGGPEVILIFQGILGGEHGNKGLFLNARQE